VPILLADDNRQCGGDLRQGVRRPSATIERYRDLDLDMVPAAACCRSGARRLRCLDAAAARLRHHGLADVMSYAIDYAGGGFSPGAAHRRNDRVRARHVRRRMGELGRALSRRGLAQAFSRFRNPELAATYKRLVREAEAAAPGARGRSRRAAHLAEVSSPRPSTPSAAPPMSWTVPSAAIAVC